jgi:hypothetical protein
LHLHYIAQFQLLSLLTLKIVGYSFPSEASFLFCAQRPWEQWIDKYSALQTLLRYLLGSLDGPTQSEGEVQLIRSSANRDDVQNPAGTANRLEGFDTNSCRVSNLSSSITRSGSTEDR